MESLAEELDNKMSSYPDWPAPGVLFRDIMPVLRDAQLLERVVALIVQGAKELSKPITVVSGLELRGFIFGPEVARRLRVPFVPVRKAGKLGPKVHQATYEKEYGKDTVECSSAIAVNSRVLIIDDLIATGGTLAAAVDLFTQAKCEIAQIFVLVELTGLNGRGKLSSDIPITALLKY